MLRSVTRWLRQTAGSRSQPENVTQDDHASSPGALSDPASAPEREELPRLLQRAQAHVRGGAMLAALEDYDRCLDLAPDSVVAHLGQAQVYRTLGRFADAADSCQIALAHAPLDADVHAEYATLLELAGESGNALAHWQAATARSTPRPEHLLGLAAAQRATGDPEAAAGTYRRLLELAPSNLACRVNLGIMLLDDYGDASGAAAKFREALEIDPACHEARANLGLALQESGRYAEAEALYAQALRVAPEFPEYRWNRGLLRLMLGKFQDGWKDYEVRFQRDGGRSARKFPFSPWHGEPLRGGRLLVFAEQGLGDEVMFASCLPDLVSGGIEVVVECNTRLATLFTRSFPDVAVHGADRDGDRSWLTRFPGIVAQIPIASLPLHFRRDRESFPERNAYLCADGGRAAHYRAELDKRGKGLRVGVSWRGGLQGTRGRLRSMELSDLERLFDLPGVQFVSLQHGVGAREAEHLDRHRVHRFELGTDIDELAAVVESLDLVITVANTNAHLAGALGKPCWVLLGPLPEWRWVQPDDRTPWYASVRLIRADSSGWAGAIDHANVRLRARVENQDRRTCWSV